MSWDLKKEPIIIEMAKGLRDLTTAGLDNFEDCQKAVPGFGPVYEMLLKEAIRREKLRRIAFTDLYK